MNSIHVPPRPVRVPLVVQVEPEVRWALKEIATARRMSVADLLRGKINELLAEKATVVARTTDPAEGDDE